MAEPASEREIERVDAGGRRAERDRLAVEAPLEIRAGGDPLVVVMRTPGEDLELARGLLFAEGVLTGPEEAARVFPVEPGALRPTEVGNVVAVDLDPAVVRERWPGRSLYAGSACGVCGKTSIDALETRAAPVRSALEVAPEVIAYLPERLRAAQKVFEETGGLHAAGAFDSAGGLLAAREDVGRHNAVDKLFGWALSAGRIPLEETILCVSGRLSFEIVQKAVVAGVPLIVAVSAPSSMAVDLAERFRVTLCGFTRRGRFNLYSHPARVRDLRGGRSES